MAIFTAIAAYVVAAIGITGTAATIFTAIGATLLSVGASRLLMKRQMGKASGGGGGGARVQLPPATENKLPVIYGSAFIGGSVTDAKISSDNKTMWYCVAMAEVTDTGGYTFDTNNIYYNGLKVNFGFNGVVTGLTNNTTPATTDTKMSGQIHIYLFQNGADVPGQNTTQTAQQIMQDIQIPVAGRWTSNDLMSNCAFAIIKVQYNAEKGTTSLGGVTAKITNSLTAPGSCIKDYMENARYGCAIPTAQIDTAALTALDTYSAETINYGTGTQRRYAIDGPLGTGNDCLSNLQILVDTTDSWLQYNEFLGKWSVIINRSYTDTTTINDLFLVDSSNLVGGINVSPINLNETFNQLEVAYPNVSIRDQTDYQLVKLQDYFPGIMSPNEAINKLDIDFPVSNNSIQSIYLGLRRLLQSREDVTVQFATDYSGIQISAGDVIRIKQEVYGWDLLNAGEGKLFRVANVSEEKYNNGSLGVSITAFEYNDTIYADRTILDFQPDPNLGIANPNIMDSPIAPRLRLNYSNSINSLEITALVPDVGLFTRLEFNYGYSPTVTDHTLYRTISNAAGDPLTQLTYSPDLIIGAQYTMQTLGTTDWDLAGGQFIDFALQWTGTVPAILQYPKGSALTVGKQYMIRTAGNVTWTNFGAPNNVVGTVFVATSQGLVTGSGPYTQTGTAWDTDFIATSATAGTGYARTSFTINMTDLPSDVYYWSITAANQTQGRDGPASDFVVWKGANVSNPQTFTVSDINSQGPGSLTMVASAAYDLTRFVAGTRVEVTGGTAGEFDSVPSAQIYTFIDEIISDTIFTVTLQPLIDLVDATVTSFPNPNNPDDGGGGIIGGDQIADGTVGFDQLGSGTGSARILGSYKYSVGLQVPDVVVPPINMTSFGVNASLSGLSTKIAPPSGIGGDVFPADRPKYLDGTTVATTQYFPYYQGTSSTANGYLVNSTSSFNPSRASQVSAGNGTANWWICEFTMFYSTYPNFLRLPAGDNFQQRWDAVVVSDIDTTIQVSGFLKFTTSDIDINMSTEESWGTFYLKANQPQVINYKSSLAGSSAIDGGGMMMRNMIAGTRVIITGATYQNLDVKG